MSEQSNLVKLRQAADNGDETAKEALAEIVQNYEQLKTAEGKKKAVAKECKERFDQEEAALKTAIEETLPAQPNKAQMQTKLEAIETHWQELNDIKAQNVEEKKETAEQVKVWKDKLDRCIRESAQLSLPGTKH